MKKVIFLFLLLLTANICSAQVYSTSQIETIESDATYIKPISDISNLASMQFELTEKQKNKIHKIVYKTNEKIAKLEEKINKTQEKLTEINEDLIDTKGNVVVAKDKKIEQIKELNTKLTLYRTEMINISRENKAKITKILTQSQNDYLNNSIN